MDVSIRYRLDLIIALLCTLVVLQFLDPGSFIAEFLLAIVLISGLVAGTVRVMNVLAE